MSLLNIGSSLPDLTVDPDRTDLDYKFYRYDLLRGTTKVYSDSSLCILGNRAFYSAATDGFGRHLKMQRNWDSNKLYNVFMIHGGIYAQDNTYGTDSRMFFVYTDPVTGEIVEVKENLMIEESNQTMHAGTM